MLVYVRVYGLLRTTPVALETGHDFSRLVEFAAQWTESVVQMIERGEIQRTGIAAVDDARCRQHTRHFAPVALATLHRE